jgi:hypothetical protein
MYAMVNRRYPVDEDIRNIGNQSLANLRSRRRKNRIVRQPYSRVHNGGNALTASVAYSNRIPCRARSCVPLQIPMQSPSLLAGLDRRV